MQCLVTQKEKNITWLQLKYNAANINMNTRTTRRFLQNEVDNPLPHPYVKLVLALKITKPRLIFWVNIKGALALLLETFF